MFRKTSVLRKCNWSEPELGNLPVAFDVNVPRLIPVRAEEDKTVGANAKNRRHADLGKLRAAPRLRRCSDPALPPSHQSAPRSPRAPVQTQASADQSGTAIRSPKPVCRLGRRTKPPPGSV